MSKQQQIERQAEAAEARFGEPVEIENGYFYPVRYLAGFELVGGLHLRPIEPEDEMERELMEALRERMEVEA